MRAAFYSSFLPPKKRGNSERMGASWQLSFEWKIIIWIGRHCNILSGPNFVRHGKFLNSRRDCRFLLLHSQPPFSPSLMRSRLLTRLSDSRKTGPNTSCESWMYSSFSNWPVMSNSALRETWYSKCLLPDNFKNFLYRHGVGTPKTARKYKKHHLDYNEFPEICRLTYTNQTYKSKREKSFLSLAKLAMEYMPWWWKDEPTRMKNLEVFQKIYWMWNLSFILVGT